jgi:hypothetical protein
MIRTKILLPVLLASTVIGGSAAFAQDGYVGLSFGQYDASNNPEDPSDPTFTGRSTTLDGLYRWTLGPGALVLEGSYRSDNIDTDILFGTEMTTQAHLAAHYVYNLGDAATVSGFLGYGVAPHDTDDEDYALVYGGVGASYAASPTFTVYGQLGIGDSPGNDTTSSSGFEGGEFARIGISYTGYAGTELSLEYERAFSDEYEDEEEPGSFGSVYFGGVTALPSNTAFQITYGARTSFFDAQSDNNRVDEVTASLGIRYVFGGKAPGDNVREGVLGSPYVPLRATNWTPALD